MHVYGGCNLYPSNPLTYSRCYGYLATTSSWRSTCSTASGHDQDFALGQSKACSVRVLAHGLRDLPTSTLTMRYLHLVYVCARVWKRTGKINMYMNESVHIHTLDSMKNKIMDKMSKSCPTAFPNTYMSNQLEGYNYTSLELITSPIQCCWTPTRQNPASQKK